MGVHLEGPYLDYNFRGMHLERAFKAPSIEEFIEYQEVSGNLVKYMTIAYEHDDDFSLTRYASRNGE